MDLSGSLSSRSGSKGSCHGGFGGGLQLRVCCWCSCLFGYGGVCLGFLRVGEIPMLGLPRRGLKADVIVVKVSGLISSCVCFPVHLEWSSMAMRGLLVASQLFRSSCSWLPGLIVLDQEIGPLVLKGLGCLGGSRGSFAASESASSRSSHPGAVVIGLVPSTVVRLAFRDCISGSGGGGNSSLYRFRRWQKRVLARFGMRSKCRWRFIRAGLGGIRKALTEKVMSLWRSSGTSYSGNVKGSPGIRGNAENLTFPRVTLMVENGYRYRRISKNILAECAGFSGWAKLGL
ncbi:hypothetical protein YC2023_068184 [Brassica napus]